MAIHGGGLDAGAAGQPRAYRYTRLYLAPATKETTPNHSKPLQTTYQTTYQTKPLQTTYHSKPLTTCSCVAFCASCPPPALSPPTRHSPLPRPPPLLPLLPLLLPTDGMVVCHLPYGPTAYFGIFNTVLRHDIGQKKEVRGWGRRRGGGGEAMGRRWRGGGGGGGEYCMFGGGVKRRLGHGTRGAL